MRFLLINTNPAVSKLVHASLERIGHEAAEISDYVGLGLDTYIAIIIDSDSYKPEYKDDLLSMSLSPSLIYLGTQNTAAPKDISFVLKKPFLPTDFISFIASILYKTPELKRFITHEAEEFKEGAMKIELGTATPQASDETAKQKTPVFNVEESTSSLAADSKISFEGDMFADFSNDLQKLYSGESIEEKAQTTNSKQTTQTINEPISFTQDALNKPSSTTPPPPPVESLADIFSGGFMFEHSDEQEKTEEAQAILETTKTSEAQKNAEVPTANNLSEFNNEKINFVFDAPNEINATEEKTEETNSIPDFTLKEPLFKMEEKPQNSEPSGVSFGDLAREFNDLIPPKSEPSANVDFGANLSDSYLNQNANNSHVEPDKFKDEIENLSETDMTKALQDGGMLPQPSDIDVAKAEIGNIVEQSVKGMLQSQILRDVLKGLKMNITITFEDK